MKKRVDRYRETLSKIESRIVFALAHQPNGDDACELYLENELRLLTAASVAVVACPDIESEELSSDLAMSTLGLALQGDRSAIGVMDGLFPQWRDRILTAWQEARGIHGNPEVQKPDLELAPGHSEGESIDT